MTTELDLDALAERWWSVRTLPIRVTSRVMAGRLRGQLAGSDRLHLGCGPNVFEGWANLDIGGGRGVTSFDLTSRLPFADASIERIYTEHFIEHLPRGSSSQGGCSGLAPPTCAYSSMSTSPLVRASGRTRVGRPTLPARC